MFLGLGPKFGLPTHEKNTPVFELITDTEYILQQGNNDQIKDVVRSKICDAISNHKKFHVPTAIQRIILNCEKETKIFLKAHEDIIILPADKGNITVAMHKIELELKISNLLSDTSTYTISKDTTSILLTKVKELVNSLVDNKYIDSVQGKKLYTNAPNPPKLYALPKIHKDGTPVRPIVSWVNSPCYLLSKYLANILHSSHIGKFNVINSTELKIALTSTKINEGEILISYDVQSLFTNVPIYLVLCMINQNWDSIATKTKMTKKWFLKCVRLCCIDSNYFVYNNVFYKQTFGCPMGSPLAPIMADIFMTKLLELSIPRFSFTPKFMFKYVDDLVSIIPNDKLDETLSILNTFHERISFTYELEREGILDYLDVKMIKNLDGSIDTKPYIKPSSKLRMLHYQSFHPSIHKKNIISGTINRLFNLSSKRFENETEGLVHQILNKNGYSSRSISSALSRFKQERLTSMRGIRLTETPSENTPHENIVTTETQHDNQITLPTYVSLSYVNKLSERIAYIIKKYSGDSVNLKIAFRINNTIKNNCFSSLKDKTEKRKISNVVYKIECVCGSNYVGQTSNYLISRMYGHNSDIKLAQKSNTITNVSSPSTSNNQLTTHTNIQAGSSPVPPSIFRRSTDKSAVYYHILETKHNMDVYNMDNIKILCNETNLFKSLMKEMLFINTTENTINKRSEIDCLSRIYCKLL